MGQRRPILVIDDEPEILSTVATILEFEGYEVEQAANGAQGLESLERITPSLVLLDMRMPILNGWDFMRIVKERGMKLPVVVMTAAQDARRWAQEVGASGYIAKPFDVDDLLTTVASLLSA